mgnify:CR=1 FL=1
MNLIQINKGIDNSFLLKAIFCLNRFKEWGVQSFNLGRYRF